MLANRVPVEVLDEPTAALELGADDLRDRRLAGPDRPVNQRVNPLRMCLL